mmetsp:Transcript_56972/g.133259  ORF Transcript_56972/g.133259 Transcript_56972/m.133259 type:complete len:475 (-) Transcript_56972:34-1458(-)
MGSLNGIFIAFTFSCLAVDGILVKPSWEAGQTQLVTSGNSHQAAYAAEQHSILWVTNTGQFCFGILLTLISVIASWFFERQLARMECLLSIGRSTCKSLPDATAIPENAGCLVHLAGPLTPEFPIQDPRFGCQQLSTSCVRLRTQVQVFQWVEARERGPQLQWSEEPQTFSFARRDPTKKTPPPPIAVGTTITNAGSVKFGSGFLLPRGLLDQCCSFTSAAKLLGSSVSTHNEKMRFLAHTDGRFYWRQGSSWTPEQLAREPAVGDLRVTFEMAKSGLATVLALQADLAGGEGGSTLLPYRLVPQMYEEAEHRMLVIQEARKSRVGLAQEDQVCPQSRLCCSCNFVASCCTGMATPEIFRLYEGHRALDACFSDLRKSSSINVGLGSWSFRLLVLSVLTAGVDVSFSEALLRTMPITIPATPGQLPRFTVSACVALATTSAIISMVFFPYKLGKACIYAVVASFFILLPLILMY